MLHKLPPFVEVLWNDAWALPTEEIDVGDAYKRNEAVPYRTRGWLIDDGPAGVILCPEENLESDGTFRGPMQIPRGMIESITELVVRRKAVPKPKAASKPSHDGASSPVMHDPPDTAKDKDPS